MSFTQKMKEETIELLRDIFNAPNADNIHGVDISLIAYIAYVESSGSPGVVHDGDAQGLMGITPKWVPNPKNKKDYHKDFHKFFTEQGLNLTKEKKKELQRTRISKILSLIKGGPASSNIKDDQHRKRIRNNVLASILLLKELQTNIKEFSSLSKFEDKDMEWMGVAWYLGQGGFKKLVERIGSSSLKRPLRDSLPKIASLVYLKAKDINVIKTRAKKMPLPSKVPELRAEERPYPTQQGLGRFRDMPNIPTGTNIPPIPRDDSPGLQGLSPLPKLKGPINDLRNYKVDFSPPPVSSVVPQGVQGSPHGLGTLQSLGSPGQSRETMLRSNRFFDQIAKQREEHAQLTLPPLQQPPPPPPPGVASGRVPPVPTSTPDLFPGRGIPPGSIGKQLEESSRPMRRRAAEQQQHVLEAQRFKQRMKEKTKRIEEEIKSILSEYGIGEG